MKKIAIAQLRSLNNVEFNFKVCEKLIKQASEQNVKFICFPEAFAFLGSSINETLSNAQPLNSNLFQSYQQLAKKYNIAISYGGFHEKVNDKIYNSNVLINNKGEILNIYRKVHLFDLTTEHLKIKESEYTEFGKELLIVDNGNIFSELIIGSTICYDLRFPEMYTLLRKIYNVNTILIPAAFTKYTGELGHWKTLLMARAIENQCFIIAPAQVGRHNEKRESYGHSMIISPLGEVLLDLGQEKEAYDLNFNYEGQLGIVEIDNWKELIEKSRNSLPVFNHRRDDLYQLTEVKRL
ncbi:hypothetical protein ABK040_011391 [Willaertia magna]